MLWCCRPAAAVAHGSAPCCVCPLAASWAQQRAVPLPSMPAVPANTTLSLPSSLLRPAAATAFAATVDAAGASTNYWLARWLLRDVVAGLFPARVHAFALEVRFPHRASTVVYRLNLNGPCAAYPACLCGWRRVGTKGHVAGWENAAAAAWGRA